MSFIDLIGIARSALLTHQRAMTVISHNVANAQTPGYSRQRLDLVPENPLMSPLGAIGRGVTATGIMRVRDAFLDLSVRADAGRMGDATTRGDVLGGVNDALMEPGDGGVAAALDSFLTSFSDLASEPSSGPQREVVRAAAQRFASQVQRVGAALGDASTQALNRLRDQVSTVNGLTKELAQVNAAIGGSGGAPSADLLDRRDALVDELAGYGDVHAVAQPDGTVNVTMGGQTLVSASRSNDLELRAAAGGGWGVALVGGASTFATGTGSLDALTTLVTTTLPGMQSRLDAYVAAAVNGINAIHRAGHTLTGATNVNFFDPAGTTAQTIAIDPAILASTDAIAAAVTNAPGDGDNALALAAFGGTPIAALGNHTLREHYATLVADVGAAADSASRDLDVAQTVSDRDETRRQNVSGVSIDEEMVNLIGEQQAYSAAARLVKVADDMMQSVLAMVGAV